MPTEFTSSRNRFLFLLFLALFVPQVSSAGVQITEVMYNPDGADTGAEWVELYNADSSAVNITGFKFNDGANHNIVDPASASGDGGRGSLTIPAGGFIILSNDPATFIARFSSFTGSVIKSALSLNNTSATLSILNDSASQQDSVSYAKEAGANDDGNSLHRSGSSLVAGAPNPGVFSGSAPAPIVSNNSSESSNSSSNNSGSSNSSGANTSSSNTSGTTQTSTSVVDPKDPPVITATATSDTTTVVGAGTAFSGQAYNSKKEPLGNARYVWNFGDGATVEGNKVLHTYAYPGAYVVTLTVANGYSTAQSQLKVTAIASDVGLVAEEDNSLLVINRSASSLNIGSWILVCADKSFMIPENTTLMGQGGIRFSSTITGLSCKTSATLNFPNGTLASKATLSATAPERGESLPATQLAPSIHQPAGSPQAAAAASSNTSKKVASASRVSSSYASEYSSGNISVTDFAPASDASQEISATSTSLTASVADSFKGMSSLLLIELTAGALALMALCATGLFYARRAFAPAVTSEEEFDIEE